jgi:hypothetical protein
MKTTVVNLRYQDYDVLIDRRTKWGNSYVEDRHGTREEVIKKYRKYIAQGEGKHLLKDLHEQRENAWAAGASLFLVMAIK